MPRSDAVRRLSDELARDPASLAFLPLAELLIGRGELDSAWIVARRGQSRHAGRADAHDLVARLAAAREDWAEARSAWARAAELAPDGSAHHVAALQGLAFVSYRLGHVGEAELHLAAAAAAGAPAEQVAAARARIRELQGPEAKRRLFASQLAAGDLAALLVDADGRVRAGEVPDSSGRDASSRVAPALAGIADAADGAMRHLALGRWERIMVEADDALVALAPVDDPGGRGVVVVASAPDTPLGHVRRLLERVSERARRWLEGT